MQTSIIYIDGTSIIPRTTRYTVGGSPVFLGTRSKLEENSPPPEKLSPFFYDSRALNESIFRSGIFQLFATPPRLNAKSKRSACYGAMTSRLTPGMMRVTDDLVISTIAVTQIGDLTIKQ